MKAILREQWNNRIWSDSINEHRKPAIRFDDDGIWSSQLENGWLFPDRVAAGHVFRKDK